MALKHTPIVHGTKRCKKCGVVKTADRFHVSPQNRDGRAGQCKDCSKIVRDAYYARIKSDPNRMAAIRQRDQKYAPRRRELQKKYRAAKPEKYREIRKRYDATKNGKAKNIAWKKQYVESGRSAERHRERYYAKHEQYLAYQRDWRKKNPEKRNAATNKWRDTPRGKSMTMLTCAAKRAKKVGLVFDLTIEDIEPSLIRGTCARTGIRFSFAKMDKRGPRPLSPSIDRIDPSIGYIKGNIQVVVWMYNRCKGIGSDADVMRMATALCETRSP